MSSQKELEAQLKVLQAGAKAAEMAENSHADKRELTGAALAGATAGMLLAGPVVAVAGAMGAAFVAASDKGQAGEVARATGRAAATAGEKAQAFDKEHHVTEKMKDAAVKAVQKAKDLDKQHHIVDKMKDATAKTIHKMQEVEKEHHITEKVSHGIVDGMNKITHALEGMGKKEAEK